jgi:transposase
MVFSAQRRGATVNVRYRIKLSDTERAELLSITEKGRGAARRFKRANILLLADEGQSDQDIASSVRVGTSTVFRTKRTFVEHGMDSALNELTRAGRPRKLDPKQEALVVATACSKAPEGRSRWTLKLLSDALVTSTDIDSISSQTIMRLLKEKEIKPWQKKMWCIPKLDAQFVAKMEHVLDLYSRPFEPKQPVVNFDEAMKQLVAETRPALPVAPGRPERYDHEYERRGAANIFLFFARYRGWRHAKVTDTKTSVDFAHCMQELVDVHYPDADVIHVVLDNLSTHCSAALYQAFQPDEALRIQRKVQLHYPPAHASWLNMVEVEIGVMNRQCLDRRIGDKDTLRSELRAWEEARNAEGATIRCLFDIDKARVKLARAYPKQETGAVTLDAEAA